MVQWREIVHVYEQALSMGATPVELKMPQKPFEALLLSSINNPTELNRLVKAKGAMPKTLGGAKITYEGDINTGRFMLMVKMPDGSMQDISGVM